MKYIYIYVAGCLGLQLVFGVALSAPKNKPNIVMIAVDDLNDWVGAYGGNSQTITPNIDRLASQGIVFTNAHTGAPACLPSRSAILSGIFPASSNLTLNTYGGVEPPWRSFPKLQTAKTLPQALKESGYEIKTSGKVFHTIEPDLQTSPPTNAPHAFTDWDSFLIPKAAFFPAKIFDNGYGNVPFGWGPIVPLVKGVENYTQPQLDRVREGMTDFVTARWAESEIRSHINDPSRPLFLSAGIQKPHLQWTIPVQYFRKFDAAKIVLPEVDFDDWDDLPRIGKEIAAGGVAGGKAPDKMHADMRAILANTPGSDRSWREAIQAYLAAINFADDAVGVMLKAVEQRVTAHPEEEWLVVFWSDHGWHLGEKMRWRKFTLWEEATRSLLIVWRPGYPGQAARVDVPVSLVDIYPTLTELAGAPVPAAVQGTSFSDLLNNSQARADGFAVSTFYEGRHSVRSKRWRYIRYEDGTEELYDHAADPNEWHNLLFQAGDAAAHQQVRNALATELYRWSVKIGNTAISSRTTIKGVSTPKFPLPTIPTLGLKQVDPFDGKTGPLDADANWTTVRAGDGGRDFALVGGKVIVPAGLRALAKADAVTLTGDFVASVKLSLPGDTAGGGILFGYVDSDNFFEFQLLNGNSTHGSVTKDVRLVQVAGGVEEELMSADLPPVTAGVHKVVVDYTAATRTLDLIVVDEKGVNSFRRTVKLTAPIAERSSFGVSSFASQQGAFDDFNVLAYRPIDINAGP